MNIRDANLDDLGIITDIYNQYIATRTIEWTERLHTIEGREAWLEAKQRAGRPVLVAELEGVVVGVGTYDDFRDSMSREGYRFTVEHSVHVAEAAQSHGVGRSLVLALIERARADGLHAMIGAIDGENPESVAFHEQLGFVEVGRLPEIGSKFGRWLDLVLVQKLL
jgi:phosphinothricin acetyltransferase